MEFLENSEGLTQLESLQIMKRLMSFVDLFIIANSSNFHDLEQEKTMTAGGIVRQSLRLGGSRDYFPKLMIEKENHSYSSYDDGCTSLHGMPISTIQFNIERPRATTRAATKSNF